LGVDAHACWVFDHKQEFAAAALEFLADGLRSGQRLAYLGSEPLDEQRELLAPLGDVGKMIDEGALQLFELGNLIQEGEPVDLKTKLAVYSAVTGAAVADGYAGLRVAAQATDLVIQPRSRDAHVQWESVADRFMSAHPLSAMCGYHRDALPEPLLGDLAAVHPASNVSPALAPFHLFAQEDGLALTGEVDLFCSADLERVLELARRVEEGVSIDLAELGFIDRHGLEALAGHSRRLAAAGGRGIHNRSATVDRLCELLELKL
jgi:ABC-type transporter Mla MlaB component